MKAAFRHWLRILARVVLGLFILWQLLFLLGTNSLNLLEFGRGYWRDETFAQRLAPDWVEEKGATYETLQTAAKVGSRWSELTQQPQDWSLFAPGVTAHIPFLELEFRWDDDPLSALPWPSPNEPEDIHRFVRFGHFRLRRYESNLDVTLSIDADKTVSAMADSWRSQIEKRLRRNDGEGAARLAAYVHWRYRAFQREHPELPVPKQAIVHVRLYTITAPGGDSRIWSQPDSRPMARWRSERSWPPSPCDVEMFNPVTECFEKLW